MRLRQYRLQKGGSLLEVMVCLFMLTTSLFGITGLKLIQTNVALQQSQHTAAWVLMEYKLTEIRYLTDSLAGFSALSSNLGGDLKAGDMQYDQHQFNLTWQVASQSTLTTSDLLKEVEVKVSWLDNTNTPQMISNKLMLSQRIVAR